jgi:hypothetical protein
MTKDQTLAALGNQLDSFYSLQQVIDIVKNIEEGSSRKITTYDLGRAIDNVISWAENNESSLIDLDSAELEMDYQNRVNVVGIPIQLENLREALENNFMDFGEEVEEESK